MGETRGWIWDVDSERVDERMGIQSVFGGPRERWAREFPLGLKLRGNPCYLNVLLFFKNAICFQEFLIGVSIRSREKVDARDQKGKNEATVLLLPIGNLMQYY